MQLSKSNPDMIEVIEMDRLYHNFSLLEKLKKGNGIFDVNHIDEVSIGRYIGGIELGEIVHSMSGGYIAAYKRLFPELSPSSDDGGATYTLRATTDELSKMRERSYNEILETNLSEKRGATLEFLKKLSTKGGRFFGDVLKEGIPSKREFIPLLYENCEDIEMHFSYEELGKDAYEVIVHLSFSFLEKKQILPSSPYLEYDENSSSIIFRGHSLSKLSRGEARLLKIFIDTGKSSLETSEVLEILDDNIKKTSREKKNNIYNAKAGLNKKFKLLFPNNKEIVYFNGRDGILHFRFPEYIKEK